MKNPPNSKTQIKVLSENGCREQYSKAQKKLLAECGHNEFRNAEYHLIEGIKEFKIAFKMAIQNIINSIRGQK